MLQGIGVTHEQEAVYERLLATPAATEADLVVAAGLDLPRVRDALAGLHALGLVSRLADEAATLVPVPPAIAIDALALRRLHEVEDARRAGAHYSALHAQHYRDRSAGGGVVAELVSGAAAVAQHYTQLLVTVQDEVRVFDTPPYVSDASSNPIEADLLARGVRCRALYDPRALAESDATADLMRLVAAGERARLADGLPMKLVIADTSRALVPMPALDATADTVALLVHPSPLLDGLIALFEAFWQRGTPLHTDPGSVAGELALPADAVAIVALLIAGYTTDAIGRQLAITPRTVHRRLDQTCAALGVTNKYQLVARATELRLLGHPDRGRDPELGA
jgi:DNA-binding CsgD family transcriptional regulator/sugar-specific transcriptional regulator TrmB